MVLVRTIRNSRMCRSVFVSERLASENLFLCANRHLLYRSKSKRSNARKDRNETRRETTLHPADGILCE
jgi:hypothetical protein